MQESLSERIKKTQERNKIITDFFTDYMENRGYKFIGKTMKKGFVVIILMHGGRTMRLYDNNTDHKFTDIALCLTPVNVNQADAFYIMFELEKKEMGSKEWKRNLKIENKLRDKEK